MTPPGATLPYNTSPIPCLSPASAIMTPNVEVNIFVALFIFILPYCGTPAPVRLKPHGAKEAT